MLIPEEALYKIDH